MWGCTVLDLVYNPACSPKTLRVEIFGNPKGGWKKQSSAMASGLTDHICTVKELLKTVVPPTLNNTKQGDHYTE